FTFWNGFRPRAAGVDQPVSFATADTTASDSVRPATDSTHVATADTAAKPAPAAPVAAPVAPAAQPAQPPHQPPHERALPAAAPPPTASAAAPFTVSFAALLNESKARILADSISVGGTRARVVPSQRAGTTIYRVVLGPYPNRAAAEQIGRDSKRSYWVFPGQP